MMVSTPSRRRMSAMASETFMGSAPPCVEGSVARMKRQRNPGSVASSECPFPDFASLHPGYKGGHLFGGDFLVVIRNRAPGRTRRRPTAAAAFSRKRPAGGEIDQMDAVTGGAADHVISQGALLELAFIDPAFDLFSGRGTVIRDDAHS